MAKRGMSDLVHTLWEFESELSGAFTYEKIQTAAAVHTARMAEQCRDILRGISGKLDSLGDDGIHVVIREAAYTARKRITKRKAAQKRKRKQTKKGK